MHPSMSMNTTATRVLAGILGILVVGVIWIASPLVNPCVKRPMPHPYYKEIGSAVKKIHLEVAFSG
jgi:hypothetical protein